MVKVNNNGMSLGGTANNEGGNDIGPNDGAKVQKRCGHHARIDSVAWLNVSKELDMKGNDRLVVVRYYLDRTGYGLHNSAARLWFHPPVDCKPIDVKDFLEKQGIALPGLLVEIYLDKYEAYMLLEACECSCVEWDFANVTYHDPGTLNIRLTDLSVAEEESNMNEADKNFPRATQAKTQQQPAQPQYANPTSAGLFSFSMMVGLETAALFGKLVPGTVDPSFALDHGPYMIFVGGLLQIFVASFNVLRNNLYGAIAFFSFSCFWFAKGLALILRLHFSPPDSEAGELLDNSDPWGLFFRSLFVFAFSCALEKQTFVMSKLSSTLIGLLCLTVAAVAFTGWSEVFQWLQLVFGTITSAFAFYVFLVEFTNGVYHRDVFPSLKWSNDHSPEEVFGAAGRSGTLFSKATRLRQARFPDVPRVRGAMDEADREASKRRLDSPRASMAASQPVIFSPPTKTDERSKMATSQPVLSTTKE